MAKVNKNPNELVGRNRLVPGRKAQHEKPAPALKMLSARVPETLVKDLDTVLASMNADRKSISKQDYLRIVITRQVAKDLDKIKAGETLNY